MLLDDVRQRLLEGKRSIRCSELGASLESLGFTVRDGNKGGHKVYTHPELNGFYSGAYNCGHGKNPEIKPAYISKILKILDAYDADLRKCLGETDYD